MGSGGVGEAEHLDRLGHDLEPAELDDRVVDDASGDPDRRLGGEILEHGLQLAAVALVGDLHRARVVAHEHELHRPLAAQGMHPAAERDGLSAVLWQGRHESAGVTIAALQGRYGPLGASATRIRAR